MHACIVNIYIYIRYEFRWNDGFLIGEDQHIDYVFLVAYRFFFDLKHQSKDFWTSELSSDILKMWESYNSKLSNNI